MPRGEFLALAARELGFRPSARCLQRALEVGAVPPPARFGRQFSFSRQRHLQPFLNYMKTRSYIGRAIVGEGSQ